MIEIKRNNAQQATERAQKPQDGFNRQAAGEYVPNTQTALKREIKPFTGIDTARDYRAMYRAAFEYHERHNPPRIDREYWQTHTPGIDETPQVELDYWEQAAQDISSACNAFNNDSFFTGLMVEVYNELGREYEAARQQAVGRNYTP